MTTYSVSVRLRRTTVEERYVSVPISESVMRTERDEDGARGLDAEKIFAAAIELGRDDDGWAAEEREVTVHPIQKAPDEVRPPLDGASDTP
ncbi:hypothetical protein [Streptomyces sp. NPDC058653]|uniref:hypothetical protein n=1 Tax=Streptomyces sp. NPDC058653 TaxID=3346576 RepID=UPI00364F999F